MADFLLISREDLPEHATRIGRVGKRMREERNTPTRRSHVGLTVMEKNEVEQTHSHINPWIDILSLVCLSNLLTCRKAVDKLYSSLE